MVHPESLYMCTGVAIFPTVVKCQHKQRRRFMSTGHRFATQNWFLWQHPFKFTKFLALGLFIDGVKRNNPHYDPCTRCRISGGDS